MFLPLLLVAVLLAPPAFSILTEQPSFVKTCKIKEKDFVNCSTNAVQNLFNQFPEGIKEINVDSLDPLKIPVVKILQGSGPVNVNASLTDVKVIGFGKSIILKNIVDPKTYDFYTDIRVPRIRIDGKYNLLGRILVIPLRGSGTCWFDASDLDIISKIDVKMEKREGYHFFNVQAAHVKFHIGGLKLHMGNLFDGIKALEDTTNKYLNENWRIVADSIHPILSKTIEDLMYGIMKDIFDNIPADFFIGDIEDID